MINRLPSTQLWNFSVVVSLIFFIGVSSCMPASDSWEIHTELHSALEAHHKKTDFYGTVLIGKGDVIVYHKTFGYADKGFKIPAGESTKYNIGSMTKMFTGTLMGRLLENGKITLNDPISTYLPDFFEHKAVENITIKQLLTHTSGLGDYLSNPEFYEKFHAYREMEDYIPLAKKAEINYAPGTFNYSNLGMLLAGMVLENVSETPYTALVENRIFDRAGMYASGFYATDDNVEDLATGYFREVKDGPILSNYLSHSVKGTSAGGSYSSATDIFAFFNSIRHNDFINSKVKKQLLTPYYSMNDPEDTSIFYGLGFAVDKTDGSYGHTGGGPGISCSAKYYPSEDYTVIVLQNYHAAWFTTDIIEEILFKG